jgi:hypothetical protein
MRRDPASNTRGYGMPLKQWIKAVADFSVVQPFGAYG